MFKDPPRCFFSFSVIFYNYVSGMSGQNTLYVQFFNLQSISPAFDCYLNIYISCCDCRHCSYVDTFVSVKIKVIYVRLESVIYCFYPINQFHNIIFKIQFLFSKKYRNLSLIFKYQSKFFDHFYSRFVEMQSTVYLSNRLPDIYIIKQRTP